MREIKFRGYGKDEHGEHWIYGNLLDEKLIGLVAIQDEKCHVWEVDPESVGQYTGMKDCEGREIYEGDIVRVIYYGEESIHVIKYCDDMDYPAFDLWPHFDCESNGLSFCECERETTITVIGNAHDNPDLLEVEHD